ncbi:FmdB family zinc ribbon protein [Desulfonema magnum]|uniref:Zinc ribbon domain-containing protein n=1 Tax=Desulfonema magnum TaxID=45655 RepID=A0A975BX08_9BACT|nr:zinc ribbon domain-containing protein [Desulfonema magnum]QTA92679.1 Zinc ribbon domain-containing protein [Desulfonema magnum]
MPIYEYHCDKCNHNFECLVLGSDQPECPSCNSKEVNKLISACGFITKGTGGETVSRSAANSSCSGCTATSCSGCGH